MSVLQIPGSPGELIDKITILEIKSTHITDPEKRANVQFELAMLNQLYADHYDDQTVIADLKSQLFAINSALWQIEDDIRVCERAQQFDHRFIELARAVYVTNDQRAAVKKKINIHLESPIVEEKSYEEYLPTS